jgi:transcriptional regulator with XRE-family HTH domain
MAKKEAVTTRANRFGAFIRQKREARNIGLRAMAQMIGVSPAYISKVERDESPPPAEDRVRAIAKIIECDSDYLLAMADRVSSDLSEIIKRRPIEMSSFLRKVEPLKPEDMRRLLDLVADLRKKTPP